MYEKKYLYKYSADDLMKSKNRREIINRLFNDDTYFDITFGVNFHDPVDTFLRQAADHKRNKDMTVYQLKLAPSEEDIKNTEDESVFYENMPFMATMGGYMLGTSYPIVCSVQAGENMGICYTFSDVNSHTGRLGKKLVERITGQELGKHDSEAKGDCFSNVKSGGEKDEN